MINLISTAILPIMVLLGLGVLLKRHFLKEEPFWRGLEWLSYFVFAPALFVSTIYNVDLSIIPTGSLVISLVVPIVAVALLVICSKRLLRIDGPQLTSLLQGSVRFNTYIGLIFASAYRGDEGVAIFALACAIVVPLVNIICVSALVHWGKPAHGSHKISFFGSLVKNPLIISCAVGFLLNVLNIPIPDLVVVSLDLAAAPALACGTLIAGAALRFVATRHDVVLMTVSVAVKLFILPLSAALIAASLGVTGTTLICIILICAGPAAPTAYVLASIMGGDKRLMAAISGCQTVCSVGTLPAVLAIGQQFVF
ncbi:AEC family transporter [Leucobacter denitrificans]|uniref:AEC family transporter n=1 Tax=Leucobacter denitrificans TaxID=683042 RepID=A0A7G9S3E2_9MICO|nr:AEC family transporter [Leucobacter denitrificans]QNN62367.1 AEC family transporter [Leucobacter denitrificans]